MVDCEGSLMTIRTDDGQRVVLGSLPSDGVMASFLNSLDILHDELSDVLLLASIQTSLRE